MPTNVQCMSWGATPAGSWVKRGSSLQASRSRRAVATVASFAVSGLLHEAILGCAVCCCSYSRMA